MMSKLGIARAALVAATLIAPLSAACAGEGYFDTAGAPLVPAAHFASGDAPATAPRQQASGYFAAAGAPLVAPNAGPADAATTKEKQQESGYFPDAGAPLVTGTIR
jgi:hypothetical protein